MISGYLLVCQEKWTKYLLEASVAALFTDLSRIKAPFNKSPRESVALYIVKMTDFCIIVVYAN